MLRSRWQFACIRSWAGPIRTPLSRRCWIKRRQLLTHKFHCLTWRHTALLRRNYKQFCCQSGVCPSQRVRPWAVFFEVAQALLQLPQLLGECGCCSHGRSMSSRNGLKPSSWRASRPSGDWASSASSSCVAAAKTRCASGSKATSNGVCFCHTASKRPACSSGISTPDCRTTQRAARRASCWASTSAGCRHAVVFVSEVFMPPWCRRMPPTNK